MAFKSVVSIMANWRKNGLKAGKWHHEMDCAAKNKQRRKKQALKKTRRDKINKYFVTTK